MTARQAWNGIFNRLIMHGWSPPGGLPHGSWKCIEDCRRDTIGSALPELEALIEHGEPHLGMMKAKLKSTEAP